MPLFGAHMSIAGGIDQAPERGRRTTCDVIQIFTKSNLQWKARPIEESERARFLENLRRFDIHMAFAHAGYLINLCSSDRSTRLRSRRALAVELQRCATLRLPFLVLHPGSHGGRGVKQGMKWIVDGIAWAHDQAGHPDDGPPPVLLLETTANQKNSIGGRFEHLAELLDRLRNVAPAGVCLDTCHIFAAGHDFRTPETYAHTMAELDATVGLEYVRVFHLNDSRGGLGSSLDRHEHIGKGRIGLCGFRLLVNDPRFQNRPMIIETPKCRTEKPDRANLRRLRGLAK